MVFLFDVYIWGERNRRFHEGKKQAASNFVNWTYNYLELYRSGQKLIEHGTKPSQSRVANQGWQPSKRRMYKLIVDVAISLNINKIGLGTIIRDSHEQVMPALSMHILGHINSK